MICFVLRFYVTTLGFTFFTKFKFLKQIKVAIAEICRFAIFPVNNLYSTFIAWDTEQHKSCAGWLLSICNLQNTENYGNNAIKRGDCITRKTTVTRERVSYCPAQLKFTILCKSRVESPGRLLADILTFMIQAMLHFCF